VSEPVPRNNARRIDNAQGPKDNQISDGPQPSEPVENGEGSTDRPGLNERPLKLFILPFFVNCTVRVFWIRTAQIRMAATYQIVGHACGVDNPNITNPWGPSAFCAEVDFEQICRSLSLGEDDVGGIGAR